MTTEPTYSQIEAAADALAQEMGVEDADSMVGARSAAKAALIAAHGIDPNVYGDMHYGWSVDGVMYQCNSVEAQRKLSGWHHDSTARLPAIEQSLAQERRRATDAEYMLAALVPMLGPKGREVWAAWQAKGVTRIHHDWVKDPMTMEGEEVAQFHLDMEDAIKDARPLTKEELENL